MRVLGTVGLPGSGKGEAATVARELGIPVVTMGDVVREECRNRGFDPADHHGRMARTLREEEGSAAIAERTIPRIEAAVETADADTVLVDGIRSLVEVETFQGAFGTDFTLIAIEAPFELRAERLSDRGRDDSDSDAERLRERDERELELGMGEVIAAADVRIENTGSLEAFHERVREIIEGDLAPIEES